MLSKDALEIIIYNSKFKKKTIRNISCIVLLSILFNIYRILNITLTKPKHIKNEDFKKWLKYYCLMADRNQGTQN